MNYALTFSAKTAKYSCHAAGCSAAQTNEDKGIYRLPDTFTTVEAAHAHADQDEQDKGGLKALWKKCPCTKV
jgi:hypothetical protein